MTSLCLRYDPDYQDHKPLLLMMGDKETTGNIRKAMPLWAEHDGVKLVVIPNAKHAANLDQPEIFHKHLLDSCHLERNPCSNLLVHIIEKEYKNATVFAFSLA